MRPSARDRSQMREINIIRDYIKHPEGSVLIEVGDTKVICTATITPGVPRFLKGQGSGWVTAEYGMLPRSTTERMQRESTQGRQGGRTLEIQRLIGRSLRSCVDLKALGENTITVDCDVIQADGGTRTASITGGCIALADAIRVLVKRYPNRPNPMKTLVAAISVGMYKGQAVVDLDYAEDSNAETDMNVIMNDEGQFIEIQGTAETKPFTQPQLNDMLSLASTSIKELIRLQQKILEKA